MLHIIDMTRRRPRPTRTRADEGEKGEKEADNVGWKSKSLDGMESGKLDGRGRGKVIVTWWAISVCEAFSGFPLSFAREI